MLYHKDVYFKSYVKPICHKFLSREKRLTKHCINALIDDKISISIFKSYLKQINKVKYDLIEVEEINNSIVKFVVRVPYSNTKNMCIVFARDINTRILTVKSIWLNDKSDKHKTLDKSKYFSLTN